MAKSKNNTIICPISDYVVRRTICRNNCKYYLKTGERKTPSGRLKSIRECNPPQEYVDIKVLGRECFSNFFDKVFNWINKDKNDSKKQEKEALKKVEEELKNDKDR